MSEWQDDGTCRQVDPDLWFEEWPSKYDPAFKMCASCPVQVECLRQSFDNKEEYGVWGGMGANERIRLQPKYRNKTMHERDTWITNLAASLRERDREVRERKAATYQRQLEANRDWKEQQRERQQAS